uniref:Putative secreted protein n=1 Tax=Amblyomma americanum TaxID=6943 RepID=A0A0C9SEC0_AMBAM
MKPRMHGVVIVLLIAAVRSDTDGGSSETKESSSVAVEEFYSGTDLISIYGVSGRHRSPCQFDLNIQNSGGHISFRRYFKEGRRWYGQNVKATRSTAANALDVTYQNHETRSEELISSSPDGKCALFRVLVRRLGQSRDPDQKMIRHSSRSNSQLTSFDFRVKLMSTSGDFERTCWQNVEQSVKHLQLPPLSPNEVIDKCREECTKQNLCEPISVPVH